MMVEGCSKILASEDKASSSSSFQSGSHVVLSVVIHARRFEFESSLGNERDLLHFIAADISRHH